MGGLRAKQAGFRHGYCEGPLFPEQDCKQAAQTAKPRLLSPLPSGKLQDVRQADRHFLWPAKKKRDRRVRMADGDIWLFTSAGCLRNCDRTDCRCIRVEKTPRTIKSVGKDKLKLVLQCLSPKVALVPDGKEGSGLVIGKTKCRDCVFQCGSW